MRDNVGIQILMSNKLKNLIETKMLKSKLLELSNISFI